MAKPTRGRMTQHAPAHGEAEHPEPREETVERAVREQREAWDDRSVLTGDTEADRSSRRGMNRQATRTGVIGAAIGAVVGVVIALVFQALPFALDIDGAGEQFLYLFLTALGMAAIGGIIGVFVSLEREDGRITREAERRRGG